MKDAASLVETVSFAAIVLLGLGLVWRKGRALGRAWAASRGGWLGGGGTPVFAPPGLTAFALPSGGSLALGAARRPAARSFACEAAEIDHPADCRHCHAPDPRTLGGERFDWRGAAVTVLAAGLRPCSGAILVLVFAFAQGVFVAGVLAVLAMSVGVATTTAALASTAVLFKSVAVRLG
ncbi:MAG: nickel transporter, partial [Caulobacteraceae bacterium]|nr:nickel transporter [Caulobacter sp.]